MKYIIVGAGIAGLTAAYGLLEKGHQVLVLEKESAIGGLAKSFQYHNFTFDIGPHRFFTDKDEIYRFIKSVLKQDYAVIVQKSSFHLLNRYFPWPLGPSTLVKLPPHLLFRIISDLFLKPKSESQNFVNSTISRYGRTLFELVFRDYTEKFCRISCKDLHANWIKVSLDKAIINKKIGLDSLLDLFSMGYASLRFKTKFLYPKGGCGRFAQTLAAMISDKGGRIIKDVKDISISCNDRQITSLSYVNSDKESAEFDRLVYTAPINQLARQLKLGAPNLEYLNSVIYNIEINKRLKISDQWIYFGDRDLSFVRVSFPRNFDKNNVPFGKDSLCVEVTCKNDSWLWSKPDSIRERVISDLGRVKLCRPRDIARIHIEKIADTYPIYKIDYLKELSDLRKKLSGFRNLTCLGRSGTFWYNNMDESIETALKFADDLGC